MIILIWKSRILLRFCTIKFIEENTRKSFDMLLREAKDFREVYLEKGGKGWQL